MLLMQLMDELNIERLEVTSRPKLIAFKPRRGYRIARKNLLLVWRSTTLYLTARMYYIISRADDVIHPCCEVKGRATPDYLLLASASCLITRGEEGSDRSSGKLIAGEQ